MKSSVALSRRLRALLLAFLLSCGFVTAVSSPAAAESSTTITAQYWWPHNGCSYVTDTPAGVSFTYACNHHDGCYAYHWASRATCDEWFLNDMRNACNRLPFMMITGCVSVGAYPYYWAVRALGQSRYDSSGLQVRINTPMKIG